MKKIVLLLLSTICFSFLVSAKTVKVGYYKDSGNFMSGFSEEDPKAGFAYEYLQTIAAYTGWTYEYKYGYFDELYEALLSGEIDILPDISYTPERAQIMYFSEYAMGAETYYLYGNGNSLDIAADDLRTLEGKSIAVGEGSYQSALFMEWISEHDVRLNMDFLPYDDVKEEDFNNGVYDLFLSIDLVSEPSWEPIAKIGSSDIYFAINKNRKDVLEELNAAQNSLYMSNPYYNSILWTKYFSNFAMSKRLSPKEKDWMYTHPKLKIGCLADDKPFAYQTKKGEVSGLIVYLMKELTETFNLPNEIFLYEFYKTSTELENALDNGEVDLAFPLNYDLEGAEKRKEFLSRIVVESSLAYVHTKKGKPLNSELKVAVRAGSRPLEVLNYSDKFKNMEILTYATNEECLDAILNGYVDGAIFGMNQVQNAIYGRRKYNKFVVTEMYDSYPLCFSVNRKNIEFISIINKLIAITTDTEIQNELINNSLIARKTSVYDFMADYLGLIIIIVIVIMTLVFALATSLSYLKKLINYDYLTHMLNRRCVVPYVKNALYRAVMKDEMFSIIVFDLDHFKRVNDKYGHDCGDTVLLKASEVITVNLSKNEAAFRWGGEEFLALVRGDEKAAFDFAEKVRTDIEKMTIIYNGEKIRITITAGIASYAPGETDKSLFIKADSNLYIGKENGRNRVVL